MATFANLRAEVESREIRARFDLEKPCVIGWQIYDPSSGAFLFEGEWREVREPKVDLRVELPAEDGEYRVHIAPVEERGRFVVIDARVNDGTAKISPARIGSLAAARWERFVRAAPKAFTLPVQSLWGNRKLILTMVRRDILARYRGSFAGSLWSFLNPLLLMATYAFVFGVVLKTRFGADTSGVEYVLYFLAGMLPWLPFAEAVGRSTYVIPEHRNFVKRLVFPLDTLPAELVFSGVVTELFALTIFLAGLLIVRHTIPISALWLPVLMVPQLMFTLGLCWFLAALGIFVRDLSQIMNFALTLWFFTTPICYPESSLPARIREFLWINPIYDLVHAYRTVLLEGRAPDGPHLTMFWIAAGAIGIAGYAWFYRMRRSFADVI
ncbi:MAG TPA: ABC transporter permease [Bryobacteraceae bacterium]|nr:ABC transporter permease [Bryobacteraceae bacterium]